MSDPQIKATHDVLNQWLMSFIGGALAGGGAVAGNVAVQGATNNISTRAAVRKRFNTAAERATEAMRRSYTESMNRMPGQQATPVDVLGNIQAAMEARAAQEAPSRRAGAANVEYGDGDYVPEAATPQNARPVPRGVEAPVRDVSPADVGVPTEGVNRAAPQNVASETEEKTPGTQSNQMTTARERIAATTELRLPHTSAEALGVKNGTNSERLTVMPESVWDAEQRRVYNAAAQKGIEVTYTLGLLDVNDANGDKVSVPAAVTSSGGLVIRADSGRSTVTEIYQNVIGGQNNVNVNPVQQQAGAENGGRGQERESPVSNAVNAQGISREQREAKNERIRNTANERTNLLKAEGYTVRKVNPYQLGMKGGDFGVDAQVPTYPIASYDEGMRETVQKLHKLTGGNVTFTGAPLRMTNGTYARAVLLENGDFVIQANDPTATLEQLAEHEVFHFVARRGGAEFQQQMDKLRAAIPEAQIDAISEAYVRMYAASVAGMSQAEAEAYVFEEIMADAVAGINEFGDTSFLTDAATAMRDVGRERYTQFDTAQNGERAPPGDRASVTGVTEKTSPEDKDIQKQIQLAMPFLAETEALFSAAKTDYEKDSAILKSGAAKYYNSIGNKVDRDNFGTIEIDEYGVGNSHAHSMTSAKNITFRAVPEILKKGLQIKRIENYEGRGLNSYTFAGKIDIDGEPSYLAAVVHELPKQNNRKRFYLHKVYDSNGNIFRFENEKKTRNDRILGNAQSAKELTNQNEFSNNDIVSQKDVGVKGENNGAQRYSLSPGEDYGKDAREATRGLRIYVPADQRQNLAHAAGFESYGKMRQAFLGYGISFSSERDGTSGEASNVWENLRDQGFFSGDLINAGDAVKEILQLARENSKKTVTEAVKREYEAQREEYEAEAQNREETDDELANSLDGILRELDEEQARRENEAAEFSGKNAWSNLDSMADDITNWGNDATLDDRVAMDPRDLIRAETKKQKRDRGKERRKSWDQWKRWWTDSGNAITDIGKKVNDDFLYPIFNMARGSTAAGVNMITGDATNIKGERTGKGLNEIFKPIRAKGEQYYNDFQEYLLHMHNVDRMRLGDRYVDMNNKPVFGYDVSAADSVIAAQKQLRAHPEFEALANEVYGYQKNLMDYRVDSGLVTREFADQLAEMYPHYVPTFRYTEKTPSGRNPNAVQVGKTVGRAEGGTSAIRPLHEAIGMQTMKTVREGSKNRFGQRLLNDARADIKDGKLSDWVVSFERATYSPVSSDAYGDGQQRYDNDNTLTIYDNGKMWTLTVNDSLFDAVKTISPTVQEATGIERGAPFIGKPFVIFQNAFQRRYF